MSLGDALQALLVATTWGFTFIAIKYGVLDAPPFLLAALRFGFAAFPAMLFVRPPRAPPRLVALYGLLIGVAQFGLLFLAVRLGMPVGLASLVMQLQAFITVFLAWAFLGEHPSRAQIVAGAIAFAGVSTIGAARLQGAAFVPFALTLAASACWAGGNLVGKFVGKVDPIAFIVWSSVVVPAPMLALSFWLEGDRAAPALEHPTLRLIGAVAVLSYAGTLLGFGVWSRLLTRYPAAVVAPFALLVPVVGMLAAWAIFGEAMSAIEFSGALLVMAGLGVNIFGERLRWAAARPRG